MNEVLGAVTSVDDWCQCLLYIPVNVMVAVCVDVCLFPVGWPQTSTTEKVTSNFWRMTWDWTQEMILSTHLKAIVRN